LKGWKIYFHSCFLEQIGELAQVVADLKAAKPDEYQRKKETKLLRAIERVIDERIVADPRHAQFRQGDTTGDGHKHRFRAKFLEQFHLFYRCSDEHKTIVIGWVNVFDTMRAYGFKTDAYKVFKGMLNVGNPPDVWDELLRQAKKATADASAPDFLS